ncbi:MAG TPA: multicopper oxidase family protein [Actinomycetota bacterium]|nr:multicopper oxidase family protein [Actinomycetota bacterium]
MNDHAGAALPLALDPADLPRAAAPATADVPDRGRYELRIHPVAKEIAGATVAMLSYGGSIPGPLLRVRQGSEILVDVVNDTPMETTVHWHGLRLANEFDGVPHETQMPIPPGGRYTHRLTFPDAGLFWYHPHVREDYAQEMGLYGNVLVDPVDPSYWPHADLHVPLTLDDVLIEDGRIGPFTPGETAFVAMGRYGNVLLTSGETEHRMDARRGEVVRLYLTNTANTRVFKVRLPDARMKLVGGDAGRYERERWVEEVVVAPSERAIVDVCFDSPGTFTLQHVTPEHVYPLSTIAVGDGDPARAVTSGFDELRVNADMVAERERSEPYVERGPDKTLALVAEMDFDEPEAGAAVVYVCPMHPEVVSDEPGSCPKCGMKLMPSEQTAAPAEHHHDHRAAAPGDGIEWEDLMPEVNRASTTANMRWKVVDRDTGKANADIDWTFEAGDQVKVRIVNEMESDHPMHHPFHVHGQRFLVLARDGRREDDLVWKDTVLVRTGETVDILLDASNPGLWMAHCHIAEHMEAGMMFDFRVRTGSP